MRKLAVCMALIIVLPALVAGDAEGSFDVVPLRGAALDVIPPCRVPLGGASFSDQQDMPVALRDAVKQKLGDLVPPDSPFDATDVVTTGHNRRLIFIWARGTRWVVATEHGGRGYSDPILAFEVTPNVKPARLIAIRTAMPKSVCVVAEELLNQRAVPAPVDGK